MVRALDGQIFCNREQFTYWTTPGAMGDAGLDLFDACAVIDFLDSDRPKLEFMNDDFAPSVSRRGRARSTRCASAGRSTSTTSRSPATGSTSTSTATASTMPADDRRATSAPAGVAQGPSTWCASIVHFHPSLQPTGQILGRGAGCEVAVGARVLAVRRRLVVRRAPLPVGAACRIAAAIPNRLSTYLLAGLPVITDRRPGCYRYDELTRLGVNVDLVDSDYEALHGRLAAETARPDKRANALDARYDYSFDASIETLLGVLELTRKRYFDRPLVERRRGTADDHAPLIHLSSFEHGAGHADSGAPADDEDPGQDDCAVASSDGHADFRRTSGPPGEDRGHRALRGTVEALPTRSRDRSQRRGRGVGPRSRVDREDADSRRCCAGVARVGIPPSSPARVWKYLRACHEMRGWRRTALIHVPAWIRQARAHEIDEVACFSTDGFPLAELLAQETRAPCRELLATGTQYFGEFAFELLAVIPYAYWLFEQGRLEFTVSTADTRALYYFSPHHIEQTTKRRYVPITEYPVGENGASHSTALHFLSTSTRRSGVLPRIDTSMPTTASSG